MSSEDDLLTDLYLDEDKNQVIDDQDNPFGVTTFDAFEDNAEIEKSLKDWFYRNNIQPVDDGIPQRFDLKSTLKLDYIGNSVDAAEWLTQKIVESLDDDTMRLVLADIDKRYQAEESAMRQDSDLGPIDPLPFPPTDPAKLKEFSDVEFFMFRYVKPDARLFYLNKWRREGITACKISDKVKEVDWTVLYAIVSRALLEKVILKQRHMFDRSKSTDFMTEFCFVQHALSHFVSEINEASTIAMLVSGNEQRLLDLVSTRQISIARSGGLAKNDKYSSLKKEVVRLYTENYQSKSNRQAAMLIAKRIDPALLNDWTGRQLLQEPESRFAIWLGQYKNGKLAT